MTGVVHPARLPARDGPLSGRNGRRRAAVALLVMAVAALLAGGVPAQAHAQLVSTTPTDRAALDTAPSVASFEFNEPVTATAGALRVFAVDGTRVDDARQVQPAADTVQVGLGDLPVGGYVATYLVTSADGHVVRGAVTFTVGGGLAVDGEAIAALFDDPAVAVWTWLARAAQAASLAVGLAALGAAVVLVTRRAPRHPGEATQRMAAVTLARTAMTWGVPLLALAIPVHLLTVAGPGLAALGNVGAWDDVLTSSVGMAQLTMVAGVLVVRAAAPSDGVGRTLLVVGGGVLVALGFALQGHTRTVDPAAVVVAADLAHVLAAAVWVGGLVTVRGVLVAADDGRLTASHAARVVVGFSRQALAAVGGVALAGAVLTWALARQPRTLVSTEWGWTLIAKLVVVVLLVAVAAFNRWRLVPLVDGASADRARPLLRSAMRVEVGLVAVLLVVTAVLTGLRPAAQQAGITGAFDTVVELDDDWTVNVVVDPNVAGVNQLHVYVLDDTRRPTDSVAGVELELLQTDQDLGPLRRSPSPAGPGHWILTGGDLAIPGRWTVTVVVARDQFTEHRVDVPVVVNPR